MKYYSCKKVKKTKVNDALPPFVMILGERSNGKTYSVLKECLEEFFEFGHEFTILRRYEEEIKSKRASQFFANLVANNEISKLSNGVYDSIVYKTGVYKFVNRTTKIVSDLPFCYVHALTSSFYDKMAGFPNVHNIIFEEFTTPRGYLNNEFFLFQNYVSTIARNSGHVRVWLVGNTVDRNCPYFHEMMIGDVTKLPVGTIKGYTYSDNEPSVVVEICSPVGVRDSDKYFKFNSKSEEMIKTGQWFTDIYPHLDIKYSLDDIVERVFIMNDYYILQCDIVIADDRMFGYVHRKTTPIQDTDNDYIITKAFTTRSNVCCNPFASTHPFFSAFAKMMRCNQICFQDNSVGDDFYAIVSKTNF